MSVLEGKYARLIGQQRAAVDWYAQREHEGILSRRDGPSIWAANNAEAHIAFIRERVAAGPELSRVELEYQQHMRQRPYDEVLRSPGRRMATEIAQPVIPGNAHLARLPGNQGQSGSGSV
jgi:hypothetical protein